MIVIINRTDPSATIAFHPIPRDRLMHLIAGYCLYNETDQLEITASWSPGKVASGVACSSELNDKITELFKPILHPNGDSHD